MTYQSAATDIPDAEWPGRPSSHLFAVRNNGIWAFLRRNTGNISLFLMNNIQSRSTLPSCGELRSVCLKKQELPRPPLYFGAFAKSDENAGFPVAWWRLRQERNCPESRGKSSPYLLCSHIVRYFQQMATGNTQTRVTRPGKAILAIRRHDGGRGVSTC